MKHDPVNPNATPRRRPRHWIALGSLCVALAFAAIVGRQLYQRRTHFSAYHLLRLKISGDTALRELARSLGMDFVPEDHKLYSSDSGASTKFALKWRFRLSHLAPTYPVPIVEDVDANGIPEVYLGSYSRKIYALDGRTGQTLWTWDLPFGVVGGRALTFANLKAMGKKALIFGSHTSLPIRVYALDTDPKLPSSRRLLWSTNVSGDFIEGGLNITRNTVGELRIVAATRDAPYSRGSLNILNAWGKRVTPPQPGLDDCLSRPALSDLTGDGNPNLIHGSHSFYGAEHGDAIVARDVDNGAILWKTVVGFDTGYTNHAVVDIDGDGWREVIAKGIETKMGDGDQQKSWVSIVLEGRTGEVRERIPFEYKGLLDFPQGDRWLLMQGGDHYLALAPGQSSRIKYRIPVPRSDPKILNAAFGFQVAGESNPSIFTLSHEAGRLVLTRHDALTGRTSATYSLEFDQPAPGPGSWTEWYRKTQPDAPTVNHGMTTLANLDEDDYWEMLFQAEDSIFAIDLPFKISDEYAPLAPLPYRSRTNLGIIFRPDRDRGQI